MWIIKIFWKNFSETIDKLQKDDIIEVTKGKKSIFSLGTTKRGRHAGSSCFATRVRFRKSALRIRVAGSKKEKFGSGGRCGTAEKLSSHVRHRNRSTESHKADPVQAGRARRYCYVQSRFKETCLTGVRSDVQLCTRGSKIRLNPIFADFRALCRPRTSAIR